MSTSRARILGSIRRSVKRGADDAPLAFEVGTRLALTPRGPIPKRATLPPAAQVDLFVTMAEATNATVAPLASLDDVPVAIADYLRSQNLPAAIRVAPGAGLREIDWASAPALSVGFGAAREADAVGVTAAFAGVAETGTLAMVSGEATPVTLNFLPETALVLLRRSTVVGSYEDMFAAVRERFGKGVMPRTVNMVTGPSRTADIEQTIQLGAHGPRRLHILLIDG